MLADFSVTRDIAVIGRRLRFLFLIFVKSAQWLCTHTWILPSLYVTLNLLFEKKIHNWPHGFMSSVTDENNFHKFDDLFQGPIISTIFLLYFQFSVN